MQGICLAFFLSFYGALAERKDAFFIGRGLRNNPATACRATLVALFEILTSFADLPLLTKTMNARARSLSVWI